MLAHSRKSRSWAWQEECVCVCVGGQLSSAAYHPDGQVPPVSWQFLNPKAMLSPVQGAERPAQSCGPGIGH